MGFIYAFMWILIGILIFIKTRKINKVFYIISLYFEFMGICWLINEFTDINVFEGTYLLVFRIVSAIVLVIASIMYFIEKRKSS